MRLLDLLTRLAREHDAKLTITIDGSGSSSVVWKVAGRRAERVCANAPVTEVLFALLKRLLIYGDVTTEELLREVTRG